MAKLEYQVFIPARAGSKRFPGKNLQILGNIPLISHSINYALNFFSSEKIWVNSDDEVILKLATEMGVQNIKRPKELAGDYTPTADVSAFQLREFEKLGVPCDAMILLQPTNPLRPENLLDEAIALFEESDRESLATFSLLNKKIGSINKNYFQPKNYTPGQRMQDLEPEYFENGLLYITKPQAIRKKTIITDDVFPFVIKDDFCHVDIDNPQDILFAEFLLKINNKINSI